MLRISLLGELRLEVDGAPAELPASRRARSLLAWLALHPGEHPRSEVAGRFWPDVLDASARTSLRGALAELRRSLDGAGDELVATRERVGLRRGVQVDAAEFAAQLEAGRIAEALALARGPVLADLDDDWIYPVRDAHRHDVIAAHGQLAAAAEARGDLTEAVALTRRQTALDPLSEELHRALMRRLAAAGDRAAAVGVYHALAERLRRDLGIAPAAETRALLAELRGPAEPVAVATADGDGAFPLPAPLGLSRAPIVGREAELGALADSVREAAAGTARLVLVAGDPGIGKTTLAREAASRAAAGGAAVLYGRCDEDGIVPYEPWVQVADHAVTHASPALLERLAAGVGPELARLAPELRRRVPDLPAPLQAEPDTERWRLFDALGGMLEEVAAERTAVVVLDDLHWADRSTLLLLRHLIRSRPHARLLVIGTYRAVELAPEAPLSAAIADLRREHLFTSIALGGLTEAQVAALVARRRGEAPEPGFARALFQETEGNPFFVEEVLRNLGERSEDRVPQGVREAVERRLARLSEPVRELLAHAAVIGRDFDLALLERLTPSTGDEVVARLEEAMRRQVIEEVGVGRYSFLHALIRATLYDGLSLTRRARLHLQIGQALEESPGAPPYGELAHHFWVAAAGELDRVADYSARAARQALEQLAYDEAAGHAIRALQALDAGVPGDPARRIELQLVLGEATDRAGDTTAARAAFADAAATARTAGDSAALAAAALGLAGPSWRSFGEIDRDAVDLLEEALAGLGEGQPDLRARLLARLAIALYFAAVPERVAALTAESVALARDHRAVAAALEARLYASWHPDALADRLEAATDLLALAEEDHRPELGALARRWMVVALLEAGEIDRARAETARHARTAETLRQPYEEMYAAVFGALWALLEGRFADAERHSAHVLEAGQHRGGADALQFAGVHAVSLAQERGGLPALEPALRANADHYPAIPAWRIALAYSLAAGGRHDDARAELDRVGSLRERLPRDANWFPGVIFAALACQRLGDADLARELRALLEPYADRCVLLGAGGALWGTVSHYLALLSAVAGEHDAAAGHWRDALERERAMGARPWAARSEAGLAAAMRALGEPGAEALEARALRVAEELGLAGFGVRSA